MGWLASTVNSFLVECFNANEKIVLETHPGVYRSTHDMLLRVPVDGIDLGLLHTLAEGCLLCSGQTAIVSRAQGKARGSCREGVRGSPLRCHLRGRRRDLVTHLAWLESSAGLSQGCLHLNIIYIIHEITDPEMGNVSKWSAQARPRLLNLFHRACAFCFNWVRLAEILIVKKLLCKGELCKV